jgi:hypothetical protein
MVSDETYIDCHLRVLALQAQLQVRDTIIAVLTADLAELTKAVAKDKAKQPQPGPDGMVVDLPVSGTPNSYWLAATNRFTKITQLLNALPASREVQQIRTQVLHLSVLMASMTKSMCPLSRYASACCGTTSDLADLRVGDSDPDQG